jgi:hypothetical protein
MRYVDVPLHKSYSFLVLRWLPFVMQPLLFSPNTVICRLSLPLEPSLKFNVVIRHSLSITLSIMRNTPTVVPPFYDSETGAPPPFPPMLTDQLELFGHVDRRPLTLIADEVLVAKASSIIPAARASSSTPAPECKLAKRVLKQSNHSPSPYLKKATFSRSRSRSPTPLPSDSAGSLDSLSDSDSSTSSLLEDLKIPKPPGEPGRPGRGGYTLHEVLDWNPRLYSKFKVR